jgi:hypothetical protein
MLARVEHLADDETLQRGDAVALDALDLGAGHRQALCERGRIERRGAVLVEPFEGDAHQPNCSRNLVSLS